MRPLPRLVLDRPAPIRKEVIGMMPTTHSTIRFASSSDSPAVRPQRRSNRSKNGPVVVRQGPRPEAKAKPQISAATAEALYRTGRLPRIGG